MQIIVVGGSASKVGKTTLACMLIKQAAANGRVVALKISKHARRRRPELTAYADAPLHVAFHDTDRFLAAGANYALLMDAGSDNFRDHLALGLRRARAFRPDTLVIESTSTGAELRVAHDSWFVAGTTPWKPHVELHFARAKHIVRSHELANFPMLASARAIVPVTQRVPTVAQTYPAPALA